MCRIKLAIRGSKDGRKQFQQGAGRILIEVGWGIRQLKASPPDAKQGTIEIGIEPFVLNHEISLEKRNFEREIASLIAAFKRITGITEVQQQQ